MDLSPQIEANLMNMARNPTGKRKGTKSRISRFSSASRAELIEFFKTQEPKLCQIWQIKTPCLICHDSIVKGQIFRSSYGHANRHVAHDKCLVTEDISQINLHPSISITVS